MLRYALAGRWFEPSFRSKTSERIIGRLSAFLYLQFIGLFQLYLIQPEFLRYRLRVKNLTGAVILTINSHENNIRV
jgi:phosphate starvation-inducible membrane PsiE